MKSLAVIPYSRLLRNGVANPKNYTRMGEVLVLLRGEKVFTIQIGPSTEMSIGCDERVVTSTIRESMEALKRVDGFLTVDTYIPHLVKAKEKEWERLIPGVVCWTVTHHKTFGYEDFENMYAERPTLTSCMTATMEMIAEMTRTREIKQPEPAEVKKAVLKILGLN